IFPRTGTAVVFLGRQWPTNTARFVLSEVATELGVGSEIFQPVSLIGDGRLDLPPSSCTPPTWNDQRVSDPGPVAEAGDWAGSYTNGDRRFLLEAADGTLVAIPFELPLPVTHHSADLHFVTMQERPFFPIRLVTDEAGRRYVLLDDRAYIHAEDQARR
ncbi:MAG TPA: hypothetical protein VLA09_13000, partial [Longimicrobiales bacterium]|nr:hypothetical protein [Longimicrobiales bacterium]